MSAPYRRLASREIYRNPWVAVEHHDMVHPGNIIGEHILIVTPPASGVVVWDADDNLYFALQPRFATDSVMLEIVKGGAAAGESPLEAAIRELQEELGLRAGCWDELGFVYELPSLMQSAVSLFLARDLHGVARSLEATETIELHRMQRTDAVAAALNGTITDAVTALAILRANALLTVA